MTPQSTIGVGMIGCGTVGSGVARLLRERGDVYAARLGKTIELRRVLVRNAQQKRDEVSAHVITDDPDTFFATEDMPIVIEVAGGAVESKPRGAGGAGVADAVADYIAKALQSGKHVVTANKRVLAAQGPALFKLARDRGVSIAFEASCAAGLPIITAIQFGLMANRISALYGILNGTCNYILTEMTQRGKTYDQALTEAQAKGFAEADPTLDVSGQDAAQKLAILASLAFGVDATEQNHWCDGIENIDLADIRFGAELGYDIKLLAIAEQASDGDRPISLRVHPCFLHADLPLAQVHGSFNALSVYGHAVGHTMYYGRGAGQLPTASAVVSDLINVAGDWYPRAFAQMNLWADAQPKRPTLPPDELHTRYYLRMNVRDVPGVMASLTRILGDAQISLSAVLQHELETYEMDAHDQAFVPVVILTHEAREGSVRSALTQIKKLDSVASTPVCIRIVDMPDEE